MLIGVDRCRELLLPLDSGQDRFVGWSAWHGVRWGRSNIKLAKREHVFWALGGRLTLTYTRRRETGGSR
jgi:hypothetical protein